ncbi:MAG: ABC transporter permease [Acidobacteria bacterium]|nr:ABC transporter permease [Acidobacteriota bacterium]
MTNLLQDFRFGLRVLLKSPGFALVAVLTLAVGIAANTAVFSWIQSVLLRPLPGVSNPETLASFENTAANGDATTVSYPDYRDYRDHLTQVSGLAMSRPSAFSVGEEDHAERVWGELVTGNYFEVMGVRPVIGRVFSRDEYGDKDGGYPVVVISETVWNRLYRRDPGVLGRTIRVNRQQLTIVGVVPAEFRGSMSGVSFEMWAPAVMAVSMNAMPDWMLRDRGSRMFFGAARLREGVSFERAAAEAKAVALEIARAHPDRNRGISVSLVPMSQAPFGAQSTIGGPLRILMAVCGVVLLIVCANVANLLLARSATRRKEFALRLALGAGRGRIVRQLLTENLLLAAAAAAVGIPLSMWMSQALGMMVPNTGFPVSLDVRLDGTVLAFTLLLCLAASVLSGMVPALHTARTDLNSTLQEGGRSGTAGGQSHRMRSLLVASEIALASVAMIGAGLFARSFQVASRIDPGFDPRGVLVSELYLSSAGYKVPDRIKFCAQLRERLESQPGVTAVTYADYIPLGFADGSWEPLQVEGYVPGPAENMNIYRTVSAPGYFNLMRIPMIDGRDFRETDDKKSGYVMVVNQTFAKRFFNGANPIGRKVHGWGAWWTVVGMVKDTKFHQPNEEQRPLFWVPFRQAYREDLGISIYVRTMGDANSAIAAMRREAAAMDPTVGMFDATPLTEFMTASLFAQKMAASLLGALGAIALALAAVGLYSVMAYSIAQRTQEFGIRMALGASPGDVLASVLKSAMGLVLGGMAVGVGAAVVLSRAVSGQLVNTSATDPMIFIAAPAFLALVGLIAAAVPALRATRIDPNVALRCQ